MRRTILISGVAIATLLMFAGACLAQELKVGFVDLMKFATKSTKAQEQQKRFAKLVDQKRQALANKKKELVDLQEQLQKQGPMLKEETRNAKIKELGIKEMELKLAEQEAQNSLQNEQREAQEIFRKDISKIIAQVRKQKNLTLILNGEALLSADDALDVTEDVIKLYDAASQSGAKPAPKPRRGGPAAAPTKPR